MVVFFWGGSPKLRPRVLGYVYIDSRSFSDSNSSDFVSGFVLAETVAKENNYTLKKMLPKPPQFTQKCMKMKRA